MRDGLHQLYAQNWIDQSPTSQPSDLDSVRGDYYSLQCCKIEVSIAMRDLKGAKMTFDSTPKFAYPELETGYLNQIALLQLDAGNLNAAKAATIARFKEAGHGMFWQNAAMILVCNEASGIVGIMDQFADGT